MIKTDENLQHSLRDKKKTGRGGLQCVHKKLVHFHNLGLNTPTLGVWPNKPGRVTGGGQRANARSCSGVTAEAVMDTSILVSD